MIADTILALIIVAFMALSVGILWSGKFRAENERQKQIIIDHAIDSEAERDND